MDKVNLLKAMDNVTDYWSPRIVGQVNDQYVKVAKFKDEFVWHKHDDEDELFYVLKGNLVIEYEGDSVALSEGDMHIVPKGTQHKPVAQDECWIVMIETVTTKHTGDVVTDQTRSIEEQRG